MYCPFCAHEETKVIDSRLAAEGQQVRRRRECLQCGERFTTFESAELVMPRIVKSDATREPFDEAKLRGGMLKALEKRPVASDAVDAAVNHICHKLRTLGEREVPARLVGELVMDELHALDEVRIDRPVSRVRELSVLPDTDRHAGRALVAELVVRQPFEHLGPRGLAMVLGGLSVMLAHVAGDCADSGPALCVGVLGDGGG
jgi:transcriptional repressor NrdR